ncbi:MAG TPA: glycosyltransferase [Longimicrobium sp.]|nr:glycosyltransferase [Longimicrobium sp.]
MGFHRVFARRIPADPAARPLRGGACAAYASPRATRFCPAPTAPLPVTLSAPVPARPITVGICTRNRRASLLRGLRALRHAADVIDRVIVVDDGSDVPVEPGLREELGEDVPPGLTVLRADPPAGPTPGRNRIAREARTPWILYLDDDAVLLSGDAVRAGMAVLERDPSVAMIAYPQSDAAGTLLPAGAQPSAATEPSLVRAFIGFAHLARRQAVLDVGGYREVLQIMGEERELSVRLLDAGHRIVYLPAHPVAHLADAAGRDAKRFLHLTVRNDVLTALLNEPLPLALATVPVRLWRYFPMRRGWGGDDPGGFRRILRAVGASLPELRRARRPVRWRTMREWWRLAESPPYHPPQDASPSSSSPKDAP